MPFSFWTSSYGIAGDAYGTLRLTAAGSRLGIPLSGAANIEMQEVSMLNSFEALGEQEEAIDFASQLNQFNRGSTSLIKNSEGRWVRQMHNRNPSSLDVARPQHDVLELDEIDELGPELGDLEDIEDGLEAEWEEAFGEYEGTFGPMTEEAILEAEEAEDFVSLARQVALVAAEATEEVAELTVAGVLGSIAGGLGAAAIMFGLTFAGNKLLAWIKKRHLDHVKDDNPIQGAIGYFVTGTISYPMRIDVVEKKRWSIFFRDLTKFWRSVVVKEGDSRVCVLNPVVKWGEMDLKPLMLRHGKLVKVNFYKEFQKGVRRRKVCPSRSSTEP